MVMHHSPCCIGGGGGDNVEYPVMSFTSAKLSLIIRAVGTVY